MNFSNSSLNKGLFERKRFVKEIIKENLHFEIKEFYLEYLKKGF